ncbi:MAG: hypothetical protein OHK0037_20730 [Elainellaceae cyanobacterium]
MARMAQQRFRAARTKVHSYIGALGYEEKNTKIETTDKADTDTESTSTESTIRENTIANSNSAMLSKALSRYLTVQSGWVRT